MRDISSTREGVDASSSTPCPNSSIQRKRPRHPLPGVTPERSEPNCPPQTKPHKKHPIASALSPEGTPLLSRARRDFTSVGVAHARRHGRLLLLPLHRHHHLLLDPLFSCALRFQLVVGGQSQRGAGLVLETLIRQRCFQWRVKHGCKETVGSGGRGGCTSPDGAPRKATANASRAGVNLPNPSLPYVPRPRVSQGSCSRLGSPACEQAHPLPDWIYSPACTHPRAPRRGSLAAPAPPLQGTRRPAALAPNLPPPACAETEGSRGNEGPNGQRARLGGTRVGDGRCHPPHRGGLTGGALWIWVGNCALRQPEGWRISHTAARPVFYYFH